MCSPWFYVLASAAAQPCCHPRDHAALPASAGPQPACHVRLACSASPLGPPKWCRGNLFSCLPLQGLTLAAISVPMQLCLSLQDLSLPPTSGWRALPAPPGPPVLLRQPVLLPASAGPQPSRCSPPGELPAVDLYGRWCRRRPAVAAAGQAPSDACLGGQLDTCSRG